MRTAVSVTIPIIVKAAKASAYKCRFREERGRMSSILFVATHATDNPFKAITPFEMAAVAADSGHEVSIALLGDAVFLMNERISKELKCLGAAPFIEALEGVTSRGVPIYVCGTCMKARGIADDDLKRHSANPMNKGVFIELAAQSDNVVTF